MFAPTPENTTKPRSQQKNNSLFLKTPSSDFIQSKTNLDQVNEQESKNQALHQTSTVSEQIQGNSFFAPQAKNTLQKAPSKQVSGKSIDKGTNVQEDQVSVIKESQEKAKETQEVNVQSPKGNQGSIKTDVTHTTSNPVKSTIKGNTTTATTASEKKEDSQKEEDKEGDDKEKTKEAAIPKAPSRPEDDPAFQEEIKKTEDTKVEKSQHPDPDSKVSEQKEAGHPSASVQSTKNDQQAHEASMSATSEEEKKREPFTPESFKKLLEKNLDDLEKQLPKNSEEAQDFRDDKPIDGIKKNIEGQVTSESDKLAGPMQKEADQPAPPTNQPTQEAQPLPPSNPGTPPKPLDSKASVPKPKTPEEISMEKESQSLDDYMTDNEITDEQLAKSNESKFTGALEEKNNAQTEAKLAPIRYRKKEQAQLATATKTATEDSNKGLDAMQAAKLLSENTVLQNQTTNKDSDKTEQEKIYADFEKIYEDTKKTVTDSLEKLSEDVDKKFSEEAESAQKTFEDNVEDGLGEIYGWTVVDDWLFGEDTEAIERLFDKEKGKFVSKMNTVLDDISVIIADGLNAALDAIAEGRKKSQEKFDSLDTSQKKLAEDAFNDFNDQYTSLEDTVYEKQEELAADLARSYKENVDSLREKFDEIKERVSAGWIGAALNALAGVVKAIMKIKDLLLGLLAAAASAIGAIISDPIGFLSNLIQGIKQGFTNFGNNIKKNIIQGLIEWLTGSLGNIGIQMPDNLFSLSGIFSLVTQMLGLTWDYFRAMAVKLLGEPIVAGMEKAVEIFTIVKEQGVKGLWEYIKEQFSNLKEMVMDAIRDMVITKVIEAGIKWILGLMSPAGAFVKAAMMIIDIVKFFVERAAQIFELVQAFIDSIKALAAGNVQAVAKGIEKALTKAIPVLIGFLASLVGITGLTGKVQKIIKKVRKKIDKAMKKIILKAKKAFKKLVNKGKAKVKGAINKVLNWFGIKKKFKTKDGKSHSASFKKKGKNKADLIIKSEPKTLDKLVKEALGRISDEDDKTKLKSTIKLRDGLMEYIQKETAKKEIKNPKSFEKKVEKDLGAITAILIETGALTADDPPPTKIVPKLSGKKPFQVTANPLSYLSGNTKGSDPKEDPAGWQLVPIFQSSSYYRFSSAEKWIKVQEGEDINEIKSRPNVRIKVAPDGWVRFHLVNEKGMHGPGVFWNLVTASTKDNNDYKNAIETKVKDKVKSDPPQTYYFDVKVSKYRDKPKFITKDGVEQKAEDVVKKEYIDLYGDLPEKLTINSWKLKKNESGEYVKDKSDIIFEDESFNFVKDINITLEPGKKVYVLTLQSEGVNKKDFGIANELTRFFKKNSFSSVGQLVNLLFTDDSKTKLSTVKSYLNAIKTALNMSSDSKTINLLENTSNSDIISAIDKKLADIESIISQKPSKEGMKNKLDKSGLKVNAFHKLKYTPQVGSIVRVRGIKFKVVKIGRSSFSSYFGGSDMPGVDYEYNWHIILKLIK